LRSADGALKPVDCPLDQKVVRTPDQQQMFNIVASHNDELTLAVKVEGVDNVEAARAIAATWRANAPSEQQAENIKHEHRCDEERNKRSKRRQ